VIEYGNQGNRFRRNQQQAVDSSWFWRNTIGISKPVKGSPMKKILFLALFASPALAQERAVAFV